ncbi:uncharacterized protein LOC131332690 [Rhododendron vialii]|uniref:uncharacterized protein LOC131332690 n=1 Tax=Rhododendron vialii TaxID=182163 RepID=UPI00265D8DAF|nr:uncharacterized protein LOC131332690 [Rhododendron vialii]
MDMTGQVICELTFVAVAKKHEDVANIVTVVGGSCKRHDALQNAQVANLQKALNGDLKSGRGLNQVTTLKRAGDTRCGSYYNTLLNLIVMFKSAIEVLGMIASDDPSTNHKAQARSIKKSMLSFKFVFSLHLVKNVMGITNELSIALQKKTQDIVNAMALVEMSKQRLQMIRDDGWDSLLAEVSSFCSNHNIPFPNMSEMFVSSDQPQRKAPQNTISYCYRNELFHTVIDLELMELNNRFTEANTELLLCMSCLNPRNSFFTFDRKKLIRLAELYPCDFSKVDLMALDIQLQNYIVDVKSNENFSKLKRIGDLAIKLVETDKHVVYRLVYLLVRLVLTLPIATATVERSFLAMKYIKSNLRNRMGDQWMNDCLVTYIESDVFDTVDNEDIMQRVVVSRDSIVQFLNTLGKILGAATDIN